MSDITKKNLNEIIENIKTKKISSTDLSLSYIKNIESSKNLIHLSQQLLNKHLKKQNNLIANQILINYCLAFL